ncbi:MAG: hypothetical protein RIB61_07055 [Roseicyclus sp.]|jgi:Ca2+-binding RTX toxin-like protein
MLRLFSKSLFSPDTAAQGVLDAGIAGHYGIPRGEKPIDDWESNHGDDQPPGGTPGRDEVFGTNADDVIDRFGHDGGERIFGFAGDDTIIAGGGDDAVFGGIGNDDLYGEGGNDTLVGGEGDDIAFGGAGADEIHTGQGADIAAGGAGDDIIFLVDDGEVDLIIFAQGDDFDIIDNFEQGFDQIALADFGFGDFGDVAGMISYSGDQAMIDLGGGDMIIFTDLGGLLNESDFIF